MTIGLGRVQCQNARCPCPPLPPAWSLRPPQGAEVCSGAPPPPAASGLLGQKEGSSGLSSVDFVQMGTRGCDRGFLSAGTSHVAPRLSSAGQQSPTAESTCFKSMPLLTAGLQAPPIHGPVWPLALRLPGGAAPLSPEGARRTCVPRGLSGSRSWGGQLWEAGGTALS